MEDVLWYLLASSRGGPTRVRIVRAIDERPRNANQLATALDLDYTTIRHHLDVLCENNVLRKSGDEYAAVYLFSDRVRTHWETLETVLDTVEPETADGGTGADGTGADGATDSTDEASTEDTTATDDDGDR